MPTISGSTKAKTYGQGGIARGGNTRGGYHTGKVFVSVNGIQRAWGRASVLDKLRDLTIMETNGGTPNRASFVVPSIGGWEPSIGMPVLITLGSKNNLKRIFGGTILSVEETNFQKPGNRFINANCVDWTWSLNRVKVIGHFTGSASTIAALLMSTYAPTGFTTRQIESGLPTIQGGITFTAVDLSKALALLAKRVPGCVQYVDYNKDLYFRVTPITAASGLTPITNPVTLTASLATLKKFRATRDLSQLANRILMEGGGAQAATEVTLNETIVPLTEAPSTWYGDTPGYALSGPSVLHFTGRQANGGGTIVGTGASPSAAPGLTLTSGAGIETGAHSYAWTAVTAAGESLPSPSVAITVGAVTDPLSAPVAATPSAGGSVDAGAHYYAVTFETAAGETLPSSVSGTITAVAGIADPTTAPTLISDVGSVGPLDPAHTYQYRYGFRKDSDGTHTAASSAASVTPASDRCFLRTDLISVPSGFSIVVYRLRDDQSSWQECQNTAQVFLQTGPSTLVYITQDNTLEANVGPVYPGDGTNNTGLQTVALSNIQVSPSALVTKRNLYRTAAGGSQLKKLAVLNDNTTTTYSDIIADSSLTTNVPTSSTAAANQVIYTRVAGPTGTTSRKYYRTVAAGSQLKLLATLADNTTLTTATDSAADATLGANAPSTDTSGLTQPAGQVLAGATSIPIAGVSAFSTSGGWAVIGNGQQFIRYTGISAQTLTGVPASGSGSIIASINYNSSITAAPCLTVSSWELAATIPKGQDVNILEIVDDTTAQTYLATIMNDGSTGVKSIVLQDRRLSRVEANSRASAKLAITARPTLAVAYLSKDMNTKAGLPIVVNLAAPTSVGDTVTIQQLTISNFSDHAAPDYTVQAAITRTAFEDLFGLEE